MPIDEGNPLFLPPLASVLLVCSLGKYEQEHRKLNKVQSWLVEDANRDTGSAKVLLPRTDHESRHYMA